MAASPSLSDLQAAADVGKDCATYAAGGYSVWPKYDPDQPKPVKLVTAKDRKEEMVDAVLASFRKVPLDGFQNQLVRHVDYRARGQLRGAITAGRLKPDHIKQLILPNWRPTARKRPSRARPDPADQAQAS